MITEKTKTKPLSAVRWVGEDLWWEGFVEKIRLEFAVEESRVLTLLTKSTLDLDPDDASSYTDYRPISNLPYLSKAHRTCCCQPL